MTAHSFTRAQVDDAIDYVAREGAYDRAQTRSYSLVFAAAGMPAPQELHQGQESHLVTQFMKAFHDRCRELGYPPLDALVVHVAGERRDWPGAGYFKVNGLDDPLSPKTRPERAVAATRYWEDEKQQCDDWGTRQRRSGRRTPDGPA